MRKLRSNLATEFYKLPLSFDPDRMQEEIDRLPGYAWGLPHYMNVDGYSKLHLISYRGTQTDRFEGPMEATPFLQQCPYVRSAISALNAVSARVRLFRLEREAEITEHYDMDHYLSWPRVRVHFPIATDPRIRFWCNGKSVHMGRGEVWLFDRFRLHKVARTESFVGTRIHVVVETSGSPEFWDLLARSERPFDPEGSTPIEAKRVTTTDAPLMTEQVRAPAVMPAGELELAISELLREAADWRTYEPKALQRFESALERFTQGWRKVWLLHGADPAGAPEYEMLGVSAYLEAQQLEADVKGPGTFAEWLGTLLVSGIYNPQYRRELTRGKDDALSLLLPWYFRVKADGAVAMLHDGVTESPVRPEQAAALVNLYSSAYMSYYDNVIVDSTTAGRVIAPALEPWVEELCKRNSVLSMPRGGGPGAMRLRDLVTVTKADAASATDQQGARRLRLARDFVLCLGDHGKGGVWLNDENRYLTTDCNPLALLPRFAGGATVGDVANALGKTGDAAYLKCIDDLVNAKVLVP